MPLFLTHHSQTRSRSLAQAAPSLKSSLAFVGPALSLLHTLHLIPVPDPMGEYPTVPLMDRLAVDTIAAFWTLVTRVLEQGPSGHSLVGKPDWDATVAATFTAACALYPAVLEAHQNEMPEVSLVPGW